MRADPTWIACNRSNECGPKRRRPMRRFFDLIVPASGYKFIVTISGGHVVQHVCKTTGEMERIATAASLNGANAFFSCANFAQPEYVDGGGTVRRRTADNALA